MLKVMVVVPIMWCSRGRNGGNLGQNGQTAGGTTGSLVVEVLQ